MTPVHLTFESVGGRFQYSKGPTMSSEQLDDLDYSFHIDGEETLDEPWMYDPEVMAELAAIDAIYEGVDQ